MNVLVLWQFLPVLESRGLLATFVEGWWNVAPNVPIVSHSMQQVFGKRQTLFLAIGLPFAHFDIPIRVVDGQVHMYIYPYLILGQATYTTCTTRSGLIHAVIFTLAVSHY